MTDQPDAAPLPPRAPDSPQPDSLAGARAALADEASSGWSEAERLAALAGYAILDTPRERDFDELVRLAADLLEAPIAAINLIDADRQWFKAEIGLDCRQLPLDAGVCPRLLQAPRGELVIGDLRRDTRFAGDPRIAAAEGLRFYAGALLETPEGLPLGTLCVLDRVPRPAGLSARQRSGLQALARQVMAQLALRRALGEQQRLREGHAREALLRRQTLDGMTGVAVVSTGLEGRVTGWNRGAARLTGWSEAEMLGQPIERLFTPEDRAAGVAAGERAAALRHGRAAGERWHMRRDGSRFLASGEMTPLHDAAGEAVGFVKAATDRSAAHHAAEALASISERYRMAASATNDAIWDHDLVSNAVLWNEALETAYGWPPAVVEPTGRWWMAQIHPEDRARVERGLQAVIEGGGTGWTEEYRFRRFDGGHAHVLDRGYVIRDAGGRPLRMIGAMLDLTERRRAEAALRESADRLRLATAAARIGTFDADFAAGALTWDDRCRELFGLPPGAPVSYAGSFLAGLHPEDRAAADAAVQRAMDPAGSGQFDVEYRTVGLADGVERWVAAQGEAIADEAGRPVRLIGTVRDIGDRKRLEQQQQQLAGRLEQLVEARTAALRRSEAQLLQSQKMEAVGQLTGGIAHDFNNLLTGITGSLELLERRLEQGRLQGLERYVGMAQGAARRAAALTHRLLAFSRQQTLDPRPTDANRLVAGIEEMIRRSIGPAIELRVAEGAALWPTLVDPNQLENALLNLCINARDAMPEGGRLTLATANVWLAEGHALTGEHGLPPGAYVAVSVADTGTGMTPEVMARAFDPFFTTKPLGQGTGLGLSMIYGFASQSGGLARIASEPGRGSTVTLYLPRHDGAAGSALETAGGTPPGGVLRSPGAAAAAWPAATGRSVLVVDDEATLRLLVTDLLTELGHRPLEAGDAAGGLALLHSDLPVDLLVADIGLPGGMNGRQMAELARAHRPGLKVLFITGYADGAGLEAALAEPGTQLLTKPFGLEALAARVGEMLAEA